MLDFYMNIDKDFDSITTNLILQFSTIIELSALQDSTLTSKAAYMQGPLEIIYCSLIAQKKLLNMLDYSEIVNIILDPFLIDHIFSNIIVNLDQDTRLGLKIRSQLILLDTLKKFILSKGIDYSDFEKIKKQFIALEVTRFNTMLESSNLSTLLSESNEDTKSIETQLEQISKHLIEKDNRAFEHSDIVNYILGPCTQSKRTDFLCIFNDLHENLVSVLKEFILKSDAYDKLDKKKKEEERLSELKFDFEGIKKVLILQQVHQSEDTVDKTTIKNEVENLVPAFPHVYQDAYSLDENRQEDAVYQDAYSLDENRQEDAFANLVAPNQHELIIDQFRRMLEESSLANLLSNANENIQSLKTALKRISTHLIEKDNSTFEHSQIVNSILDPSTSFYSTDLYNSTELQKDLIGTFKKFILESDAAVKLGNNKKETKKLAELQFDYKGIRKSLQNNQSSFLTFLCSCISRGVSREN